MTGDEKIIYVMIIFSKMFPFCLEDYTLVLLKVEKHIRSNTMQIG